MLTTSPARKEEHHKLYTFFKFVEVGFGGFLFVLTELVRKCNRAPVGPSCQSNIMIRNNSAVRLTDRKENRKSKYLLQSKKPHETSERQPAAKDWWP